MGAGGRARVGPGRQVRAVSEGAVPTHGAGQHAGCAPPPDARRVQGGGAGNGAQLISNSQQRSAQTSHFIHIYCGIVVISITVQSNSCTGRYAPPESYIARVVMQFQFDIAYNNNCDPRPPRASAASRQHVAVPPMRVVVVAHN